MQLNIIEMQAIEFVCKYQNIDISFCYIDEDKGELFVPEFFSKNTKDQLMLITKDGRVKVAEGKTPLLFSYLNESFKDQLYDTDTNLEKYNILLELLEQETSIDKSRYLKVPNNYENKEFNPSNQVFNLRDKNNVLINGAILNKENYELKGFLVK